MERKQAENPFVDPLTGEAKVGYTEQCLGGVITVERRQNDWMAYIGGDRRFWASGATFTSAIGDLVRTHPGAIEAAIRGDLES